MKNCRSGFTLVEISIVLVVIGLVTASILLGRDLIRASEIRATVSQVEQMRTAVNTFKIKYGGLPGDLRDATIHWPETVNGNGNGVLSTVNSPDADSDGQDEYEYLRVAQHLSLAHLIQGAFTGKVPDPASNYYEIGTNVIPSKCCGKAGFVFWDNTTSAPAKFIGPAYNNSKFLILGGIRNVNNVPQFIVSALLPSEAWAIDVKNDDGVAYSGATFGLTSTSKIGLAYLPTMCSSSYLAAGGADYLLTNDFEPACSMYFLLEK